MWGKLGFALSDFGSGFRAVVFPPSSSQAPLLSVSDPRGASAVAGEMTQKKTDDFKTHTERWYLKSEMFRKIWFDGRWCRLIKINAVDIYSYCYDYLEYGFIWSPLVKTFQQHAADMTDVLWPPEVQRDWHSENIWTCAFQSEMSK